MPLEVPFRRFLDQQQTWENLQAQQAQFQAQAGGGETPTGTNPGTTLPVEAS